MKIAYILSHDIDRNDGVVKKIIDQTKTWEKQDHQVEIFTICNSKGHSKLDTKKYPFSGAMKSRILVNDKLYSDVESFSPDIIYFRYDFWNSTVFALSKKFNLIIESNTASKKEALLQLRAERSLKALLRYMSIQLFDDVFRKRIKGVVSVTEEIFKLEYDSKKLPNITIPNSVPLSNYSIIKSENKDSKVNLCFLGSPNQPWHGVDIIQDLAKKLPNYVFHIIGSDGENTENLKYHGYLSKEHYLEILKKCSIAIGSLALYRNGLIQACPLKVREYLLGGFPIIIGYDDIVNKDKPSWCFELKSSSDETITKLIDFIEKNKNYVVPVEELKAISLDDNETKRLEFFKKVISSDE